MEKRLIAVKELSEYISMPVPTIYTYVSTGKIPADCIKRIGRALKFEVEAVNRWISAVSASPASFQVHKRSAR